jgi:hypothetical protein
MVSVNWICAIMTQNPFFLYNVIMTYSIYKHSYLPILEFEKDPGIKSAKKMKINSYKYLMALFLILYVDRAHRAVLKY